VRHKEDGRLKRIDQGVLDIAVPGGVAAVLSRQFRDINCPHTDGNLVEVSMPLEVAAQRSDVADTEQVVAGEFMLHTEAELVDLRPLLVSRDIRETCGPYGSRPDVLIADDVINGQVRCRWGVAVEPRSCLEWVAAVPGERIAPADHGFAGSDGVVGKAQAWRKCTVVRIVTASRNAAASAFEQAVPVVQIIGPCPRDDVPVPIQLGLIRWIVLARIENGVIGGFHRVIEWGQIVVADSQIQSQPWRYSPIVLEVWLEIPLAPMAKCCAPE